MKLVDANVLLNAVNKASDQHARANRWLDAAISASESVGFAWVAVLAFLRVATRPSAFSRPLTVPAATAVLRGWFAQPSTVIVTPTARHLDLMTGLLAEAGTGGNLVNDAHLAALALEHNATIVSFDRDFGRFAGVRLEVP